ncbi:glycosyltransferase-like domain-containing protein 1 [Arapaima gigas]
MEGKQKPGRCCGSERGAHGRGCSRCAVRDSSSARHTHWMSSRSVARGPSVAVTSTLRREVCHPMSVILVEPFYGGSHKQLTDLLQEDVADCTVYTLPAKKWHWRARTAALHFMQAIPASPSYRVLFASSVLNLAELVALRPDLGKLRKILYFHENQLVYPVRKSQERDFQYGYNQILSCLVADVVVFNSSFNMESFLTSIHTFVKLIPDHRPRDLEALIRPKCQVLHFPIRFPDVRRFLPQHKRSRIQGETLLTENRIPETPDSPVVSENCTLMEGPELNIQGPVLGVQIESQAPLSQEFLCTSQSTAKTLYGHGSAAPTRGTEATWGTCGVGSSHREPLHIVWPHRWEHDKDPELFFYTLLKLKERGLSFQVSVLGETFTEVPAIFTEAKDTLGECIVHWGYIPSKKEYLEALCQADVVVSTAKHEFFGVAMLEAVHCGCYPLCPNALVYPEIFPAEYLYSTPEQLLKRLQGFCRRPDVVRRHCVQVDTALFSWAALRLRFRTLLAASAAEGL